MITHTHTHTHETKTFFFLSWETFKKKWSSDMLVFFWGRERGGERWVPFSGQQYQDVPGTRRTISSHHRQPERDYHRTDAPIVPAVIPEINANHKTNINADNPAIDKDRALRIKHDAFLGHGEEKKKMAFRVFLDRFTLRWTALKATRCGGQSNPMPCECHVIPGRDAATRWARSQVIRSLQLDWLGWLI